MNPSSYYNAKSISFLVLVSFLVKVSFLVSGSTEIASPPEEASYADKGSADRGYSMEKVSSISKGAFIV
jgi:hypothetical protein